MGTNNFLILAGILEDNDHNNVNKFLIRTSILIITERDDG